MAERTSISGGVAVQSADSKYRVILDLAILMAANDKSGADKDDLYWLTKYKRAESAVDRMSSPQQILTAYP